jgi:hypothetical protein
MAATKVMGPIDPVAAKTQGEADNAAVGVNSLADIEPMDANSVRRALTVLGLPTSGKLSKLKERLRESIEWEK